MKIQEYKERKLSVGDKISVYRNLHKDGISIKKDNLVHGHAQLVSMANVSFSVGKAGNKKVRETGHKNVHALVNGTIINAEEVEDVDALYLELEKRGCKRVYYNPYKVTTFVEYGSNKPISEAQMAIVVMDRVYVL